MKQFFDSLLSRKPLLRYALISFAKSFLIGGGSAVVIFTVLSLTGVYKTLEKSLNLKASSPFVLVPLYAFAALTVICFLVGALMYFVKYNRPRSMTEFRKNFDAVLNAENENATK